MQAEAILYVLWIASGGVAVRAVPATVDCGTLAVLPSVDVPASPSPASAWVVVRARWHVTARRAGNAWRLAPAGRREERYLRAICSGRR